MTDPLKGDGLLARQITAGAMRHLESLGHSAIDEFPLRSGRRADIAAIDRKGRITIVEVKSSRADFTSDNKWGEYLDFCDRFYFAVAADFPRALFEAPASLPDETGIIVADRFGGEILRQAAVRRISPARRRNITLRFARIAADRLARRTAGSGAIPPGVGGIDQ